MCEVFDRVLERAADYGNRRGRSLRAAERFIRRAWGNVGTFGIEHVECAGRSARYINTGDTYSATILSERGAPLVVTTWGDWVEQVEREHCEEEDVIRCAYCGEFTPLGTGNWRDTVCESCGHSVDGSN